MKKRFIFPILLFVLLLSACNYGDELSGKTFDVAYWGPESDTHYSEVTLEFLDGNIVENTKGNEEGTYDLKEDTLVILFENENENLEFIFTVTENDKDSSKYSAVISDVVYEVSDTDKIKTYQNLLFKLEKGRNYEFIKR